MENLSNNNYFLIGLPTSGKSTFIAALWHLIESEEIDKSLKITSLPKDSEYLSNLRRAWLACNHLERTKVNSTYKISLNVIWENGTAELNFPDVSGEMYNLQFEQRKIDLEYYNQINNSNGIILFLNPSEIFEPISIFEGNLLLPSDTTQPEEDKPVEWTHKFAPTQVILVDLLQIIRANSKKKLKLAIILSAWDVVINSADLTLRTKSPDDWLKDKCPLLYQYLIKNDSFQPIRIFGISAQGGNYTSDLERLKEQNIPSERIIVRSNGITSSDLSLPIKWLLENE